MAGNNLQLTFAVARCDECKAENKLYEILRILQWRCADNIASALAYDKETEQILAIFLITSGIGLLVMCGGFTYATIKETNSNTVISQDQIHQMQQKN